MLRNILSRLRSRIGRRGRQPQTRRNGQTQFRQVVERLEDRTLLSSADLVPENISLSAASLAANNSVNVSFGIHNQGNAGAGASTTRLRLSSSPTGSRLSDPVLADVALPALAAGASSSFTTAVTIPAGTAPGTFYVWVIADNFSKVIQSNSSNDFARSGALTVTSVSLNNTLVPPTLLSPGTSAAPGSVIASVTPTFQWQAVAGADSYGLFISQSPYGSQNLVFDSEASGVAISGTSFVLPAGILQNGGQYRWNMSTHKNGAFGTTYSTPQYFSVHLADLTPDLVVRNLTVTPASGTPGSTATVSFAIQNQGNATANPFLTNVRLGASATQVTTSDVKLVESGISVPALAPGQSMSFSRNFVIPSAVPGDYRVWIIADVNSEAGQRPADEANDKLNTRFTVTSPGSSQQASLHYQDVPLAQTAYDGSGADISVTLTGVPQDQFVELFAGASVSDWRSLGISQNRNGEATWSLPIDLAGLGLPYASHIVVQSTASFVVQSTNTLHASPIDFLQPVLAPTTIAALPVVGQFQYENVAKVYRWNWDTQKYVLLDGTSGNKLTDIYWEKETIVLTHGWDDKLNDDAVTSQNSDEYMIAFAVNFSIGRTAQPGLARTLGRMGK